MKRSSITGFVLAAIIMITAVSAGTTAVSAKADESGNGNITLTEYASYEDYLDWIYDSSILFSYDSGLIMDVDGNLLSEESFYDVTDGYLKYLICTKDEKDAVYDYSGNIIIPFEYDKIYGMPDCWVEAHYAEESDVNDYNYSIYRNGEPVYKRFVSTFIYYFGGGTPILVAELDPDDYKDIYAENDYVNIEYKDGSIVSYDTSFNILETDLQSIYQMPETYDSGFFLNTEGDLKGVVDGADNTIIDTAYKDIVWHSIEGFFIVYDGAHYGIIDEEGNMLVPVEFDEIETTMYNPLSGDIYFVMNCISNGYVDARKDGQAVFYNVETGTVFETGLSDDSVKYLGATLTYNDDSGNPYILSADGVVTDLSGYSDYFVMEYSAGMMFEAFDENECTYLIDWHGNVLFSSENYLYLRLSADGKYLLADDLSGSNIIYTVNYPSGNTNAAPAPADTAAGTGEGSAASIIEQLLMGIRSLAETDYDTNKETIQSLLDQVCAILGDSYPDTVFMLDSASRLIGYDAATGESVIVFIDAALSTLGSADDTSEKTGPSEDKTENVTDEGAVDLSGIWAFVGRGYYEDILNGEFEETMEDQADYYGVINYVMVFDDGYVFKYRETDTAAEVTKYVMSLDGDVITTSAYNSFYAAVDDYNQAVIDGDTLYLISIDGPDDRITGGELSYSQANAYTVVLKRTDGPDVPDVENLEITGDDPITGKWSVNKVIMGEEIMEFPTDELDAAEIIFTGGKAYFNSMVSDGSISTIIESYEIYGTNLNFSSTGPALYLAIEGQMILSQGDTQYYLLKE